MNAVRRYLRIAFVVQLALVVLASPAAHVHRDGGSCGSHGSSACGGSHVHIGCSHGAHDHAPGPSERTAPGELSIAAASDASDVDRCAACELQRLIGQAHHAADRPTLERALSFETAPIVAVIDGRSLDAPCCRGPPVAC